jgi:hypothetical protein
VGDHAVGAGERKPSGYDMPVWLCWEAPHAVDPMRDTFQCVALRCVVGQRGTWDFRVYGLVSCEEPALALGDLVKPIHDRSITRIYGISVHIRDNNRHPESGALRGFIPRMLSRGVLTTDPSGARPHIPC